MPRLHVLIDNTIHPQAPAGLAKEHGLAMALELPQGLLLWDSGASPAFLENARLMGLDLLAPDAVAAIALSHGHWDHSGGLASLRAAGCTAVLYAHQDAYSKRYRHYPDKPVGEIGWRGGDAREPFREVVQEEEIFPGCWLHTALPRQEGRFQAVADFYWDAACSRPDTVPDDAALLLHGQQGASVILGCCHSGLANTLDALQQRSGLAAFHTLVGGLHLMHPPQGALEETLETLQRFRVQRVFAGHCSGEQALQQLRAALPAVVQPLGGGRTLELPG